MGAGAAGTHAAETLRVAGYQGRIVMVTRDDRLPYDRTTLSKNYFTGKLTADQIVLRSAEFYQQHDTETAAIVELIRLDQMPTPDDLRQGQFKQIYPVLLGDRLAKSN